VITAIASYRWYTFIDNKGIQFSIPQVSLALQVVCNILRVIFMIDPILFNGTFNKPTALTLGSIPDAFNFASILLIACYWSDLMNHFRLFRNSTSSFLKKYRNGYLVAVSIVFVVLFVVGITSGLELSIYLEFIQVIIPGVICLFIAIYFIRSGYLMLGALGQSASSTTAALQKQITKLIYTVGILSIGYIIAIALTPTAASGASANAFMAIYFLVYLFGWALSLCVALAFRTGNGVDSTSSHQSSGTESKAGVSMKPHDEEESPSEKRKTGTDESIA